MIQSIFILAISLTDNHLKYSALQKNLSLTKRLKYVHCFNLLLSRGFHLSQGSVSGSAC